MPANNCQHLTRLEITGKDAEEALGRAGITVNKNAIPFDQRSPLLTSGVRIGTPYITSRGMTSDHMKQIGNLIAGILREPRNESLLKTTATEVKSLCDAFPLYPQRDA